MRAPPSIVLVAAVAMQSAALGKDIATIAKGANGAVVSIIMSDKDGRPVAQGSGFVVSKEGRIVTNYHVIKSGSSAVVKLPDGAFFVVDGVLTFDKDRDIAIIKAHGENFRTVTLGDSSRVQVGDEVIAIGNPLSLESTVSNGIVSGIRTVGEQSAKVLQITAPISPGSSGGPLFDIAGKVVGMTTSTVKGGENLNFAVPINEVNRMLQSGLSGLLDFPNEPEVEDKAETGKRNVGHPRTDRDYYQQLYDSGAFYDDLRILDDKHFVCFDENENSGEFFVFVARRYTQEYSDAFARVLALHFDSNLDLRKAIQTVDSIQTAMPYVNFWNGDWASWRGAWSSISKDDPGRSRFLLAFIYENGVNTGGELWSWDESSQSWEIQEPDTSGGYTKSDWTWRLSIEPTTMRYVRSGTLTTTVGVGETKVVGSKTGHQHSGACERLTRRPGWDSNHQ